MAEVTLTLLGEHIQTLIGEVRRLSGEVAQMRSEMDGQFSLMTAKNAGVEALERLVADHGRRITALERKP
jgi:hypothetical protein